MRSISYVMVSFGYWNLYRKSTHERLILSPKTLSLTSDHHCVTKREVIACNKLFACKSNIWKGGAGHWHLFGADLPHRSYGMCICRREVEGDLGVFFPLFPPCLLSSLRYSFLFSTFQIKWHNGILVAHWQKISLNSKLNANSIKILSPDATCCLASHIFTSLGFGSNSCQEIETLFLPFFLIDGF